MRITQKHSSPGFTMIEVAISLGIIAFALVAIIGILPTGLTTQRDSKEDTWILQDASFLSDCIKHSLKGNRFLSSNIDYVMIVNSATGTNTVDNYDGKFNSDVLLGLLTTPKYAPDGSTNIVTARVRALSGNPSEQTGAAGLSFAYLLTVDVIPHRETFTNSVAYSFEEYSARTNIYRQLTNNLYDLRLSFNWPILPKGDFGNGRYVYRSMVAAPILVTNVSTRNLYYFDEATFSKIP